MSRKRCLLSLLILTALAGSLRAEPLQPLDLIPEDACIGIAVRNLAELRTKGDRVLGKQNPGLPRPSQLLDMAFQMLKLGWKIDEKKPAGLVCLSGPLGGLAADSNPEREFTIGAVLACQSLEEMARVYKLNVEELKKGQVHKVLGQAEFGPQFGTNQVGVRGDQVFLTNREKATAAWMKARSLRPALPAARQRRLDLADGLFYFGPPLLRLAQKDFDPESVDKQLGPQEKEAELRLNRAFLEARQVLGAFRVENGIGLDVSLGFDPKGKHAPVVLKAIGGGGRTSNLKGLPDSERLVGALAVVGLDRADLPLARVLIGHLWTGLRGQSPILDSDALLLRRVFGDFYSRLRLGRMAAYQSSDPANVGQLAALAILDPVDPDQFLTELTQYVKLGNVEQFDPKKEAGKAQIEKLIAELGSDDFQARESATTKLELIGDSALPYLEKAEKSEDAEVRRRAEELRASLRAAAELRKKELTEGLVKKAFRPTFTMQLKAEKRGDADVHLLGMRLPDDAPFAASLKEFFGPQWNRLRLTVVNKQVIILFGSDLALLDQAIQNVRQGKPGLEQSAHLADFRKQVSPERRMELHLAPGRVRTLLTPANQLPPGFKPSGRCISTALRTGLNDLGFDLWVPAESLAEFLR